jgi:hypothetical protein
MASAVAQVVRRTSIAGRCLIPTVIREQATTAVTTSGDTLQQRTAFSHGSSRLLSFSTGVAPDTFLVGLKRWPIHKPKVMVMD